MNNQQPPLTSEELYALTLSATPGKDHFNKTLPRNDEIKNIIIASLLGSTYTGFSYYHAPTEHKDNRRIDIAYYPVTASDNHPPIIMEIQHKITQDYLWAKKVNIYNADSIVKSLAQPMPLFIALQFAEFKTFEIAESPEGVASNVNARGCVFDAARARFVFANFLIVVFNQAKQIELRRKKQEASHSRYK
ncbi:hypothetical protein BD560DRAFT_429185 [Blakeslea trispora]|nr:hypothetical protein BD560DRAFT_429185 [Blakeslea trispora]